MTTPNDYTLEQWFMIQPEEFRRELNRQVSERVAGNPDMLRSTVQMELIRREYERVLIQAEAERIVRAQTDTICKMNEWPLLTDEEWHVRKKKGELSLRLECSTLALKRGISLGVEIRPVEKFKIWFADGTVVEYRASDPRDPEHVAMVTKVLRDSLHLNRVKPE